MTDDQQWTWWRNALVGQRGETTPGNPMSGFYRTRRSAIAIWRDETGVLRCVVNNREINQSDVIDDLFGFACVYPIPFDVYEAVAAGEPWPEEYLVDLRIRDIQAGIAWTLDYARERLAATKQKVKAS